MKGSEHMGKNRTKKGPAPKQHTDTPVKKKKTNKEDDSNQGKIILIVGCIILGLIIVLLVVLAIFNFSGDKNEQTQVSSTAANSEEFSSVSQTSYENSTASAAQTSFEIPEFLKDVEIDQTKDYYASIDIKDYGTIIVKLDYNAAPISVRNFIYLADSGFYNGLTFHRIMEGFMIQGGDPDGNGTGGSPNNITGEFSANGYNNPISHTRGVISMARATPPNSASSQFFIVQTDDHVNSLDGNYAAFGKVTAGMDIVDKIASDAEPTDNNGTIPAEQQPVINSITISTQDIS